MRLLPRLCVASALLIACSSCLGGADLPLDQPADTSTQDTNVNPAPSPSAQAYSLALTAGAGGSVAASPSGPSYSAGALVTLTATAASGMKVASWTGTNNDVLTTTVNTVTMNSDRSVNVAFTAVTSATHTLTLNPGPSGSLAASPQQSSYSDGTVVTLTATAATGYKVGTWSGTDNDASTAATNQVTMTANKTIGVTFVAATTQYLLTWHTPDNWGTIQVSPPGTSVSANSALYDAGTVVTVTGAAFASSPWKFGCFFFTDEQTTEPGVANVQSDVDHVTMNANKNIYAYFPYQSDTTGQCPEAGFGPAPSP